MPGFDYRKTEVQFTRISSLGSKLFRKFSFVTCLPINAKNILTFTVWSIGNFDFKLGVAEMTTSDDVKHGSLDKNRASN